MTTEQATFAVDGQGLCAAWVTASAGVGPFPAVVPVPGFGATRDMALPAYERSFAEAGMVVVSFDHRFTGASPGEPRQVLRIRNLLADTSAAVDFAKGLRQVDAGRVALWGTSLGASHAMVTAARRKDIAALVVSCPMIDGRNAALRLGLGTVARLLWPIASDLVRAGIGMAPRYVPLVGEPGEFAMIASAGAKRGWYSLVPDATAWDNRTSAAIGFDLLRYRAVTVASRIECPVLVCVSENETLMDPRISVEATRLAPLGRSISYPADHFEVYHPPLVERIRADQVSFLVDALSGTAA